MKNGASRLIDLSVTIRYTFCCGSGYVPVGFMGFKPVGRHTVSSVGSTPIRSRHLFK